MAVRPGNHAYLFSRTVGSGPDLVLVHGLGASHAFWFPKVARDLARDHRVTVCDLRGHGRSAMPPSGYDPTAMAGDLVALLDKLGMNAAHVVGHSYGGLAALELAVTRPHRVASLVIADSRLAWQGGAEPLDRRALERLARAPGSLDRGLGQRGAFSPFAGFGGGRRSRERFLTLLASTSAAREFERPGAVVPARLAALDLPVLAAYGELSFALPSGRLLAGVIPGARLVVVPGSGHFHPVVAPESFLAAVRGFVAEATKWSVRARV